MMVPYKWIRALVCVGVIGSVFMALCTSSVAHAQSVPRVASSSSPTLVATVNIQNATFTQQGGTLSISFDLTNRIIPQQGVLYAVALVGTGGKGGQFIAAEKVFNDPTDLPEHSSVHKNITYTAPASLSGTYQVVLLSKNASGFPFATVPIGKVTLDASAGISIDAGSCYLTISDDSGATQYQLLQGVDITPSETLILHCSATNLGPATSELPHYETQYRSAFGDTVAASGGDTGAIAFASHATKQIALVLPKPNQPQAYDTIVTIGQSNPIDVHYVLQGESATIADLSLDKGSYNPGDTAVATLNWSAAAQNFFGSRAKPLSENGLQATLRITDQGGAPCGNDVTTALVQGSPIQKIYFPVSRSCISPSVSVSISDASGTTLASESFTFAASKPASSASHGTLATLLLAAFAIVVVIWVVMKRRGLVRPIVIFIIVAGGLGAFGSPHMAQADTYSQIVYLNSVGGWGGWEAVNYTANIDSSSYTPGATITGSGSVSSAACGNSFYSNEKATINGSTQYVYELAITGYTTVDGVPNEPVYTPVVTSASFTAPSTPGSYNASFYYDMEVPTSGVGAGSTFCLPAGTAGTSGSNADCGSYVAQGSNGWPPPVSTPMSSFTAVTPYNIPYTVVCPSGTGWNGSACVSTGLVQGYLGYYITQNGSQVFWPNNTGGATITDDMGNSYAQPGNQYVYHTVQLSGGTHTITSTIPTGYAVSYNANVNSSPWTNGSSASVNVVPGGAVNLWWMYTAPPTSVSGSCSADGKTGTLSWTSGGGTSANALRYAPANGSCGSGWTLNSSYNECDINSYTGSSPVAFPTTPGTTYSIWVHDINSAGGWTSATSNSISCPISASLSGSGCVLSAGQTSCTTDTWWSVGTMPSGDTLGLQITGPGISMLRNLRDTPESDWYNLANLAAIAVRTGLSTTVSQSSPHQETVTPGSSGAQFTFQLMAISGATESPIGNQLTLAACPAGDYIVKDPTTGNETCALVPNNSSCNPGGAACVGNVLTNYDTTCSVVSSFRCPYKCGIQSGTAQCIPPPAANVVQFNATPSLVRKNGTTTVNWDINNVGGCTSVAGDPNGPWDPSSSCSSNGDGTYHCQGSHDSSPLADQTVFSMSCTDFSGNPVSIEPATVDIIPAYQER